jgi:hypothetical protein
VKERCWTCRRSAPWLRRSERDYASAPLYFAVPFPYYNTFYGYYGSLYPVVYSPDYLQVEKKVHIETNLYLTSTQEGQLLWTGITDTLNPSDVHKAIKGLVKLVVAKMQNEQVL